MIELLVTGAVGLLLVAAVLAPMETLGWWAGWISAPTSTDSTAGPAQPDQPAGGTAVERVVVYLSGVGIVTGDRFYGDEQAFVDHLRTRLRDSVVVADVFPYSVLNTGIIGHRPLQRFWSYVVGKRSWERPSVFDVPVILRNVLQVAVSADSRYGPIYNLGMAREIVRAVQRSGHRTDGAPLVIVGYSGGAQVGLGAAPYLSALLEVPIQLVSLGGVTSGDIGIRYVERLDHLYGTRDPVWRLGPICYPSRWPVFRRTVWNRAAPGRVHERAIGPFAHFGPGSYFDPRRTLPDGGSYLERSAEAVVAAITDHRSTPARPAAGPGG